MTGRSRLTWLVLACLAGWPLCAAVAQDRSLGGVPHGASPQERLLMEQIDQLASAGQYAEALSSLDRLVDNSQGRLIETGPVATAATLSVQVHTPILRWAAWRLSNWSRWAPEAFATAVRTETSLAAPAIAAAKSHLDAASLHQIVDRYTLAPAASDARLFLADLYLDSGWTAAARDALEAPGLSLRAHPLGDAGNSASQVAPLPGDARIPPGPADLTGSGLPWSHVWPHVRSSPKLGELLDGSWRLLADYPDARTDALGFELLKRLLTIAAFDATTSELEDTCAWIESMGQRLPPQQQQELSAAIAQSKLWHGQRQVAVIAARADRWPTFAGDAARSGQSGPQPGSIELGSWPKWTLQLERITGASDRNPATKPPVAENSLALLPYHPVVYQQRVYIHELTRITAYDLSDGKQWPPSDPALPIFESGMTAANYLPFGYAVMGAPRGTLVIDRDTLFARMGPPVTGWFGRAPGRHPDSLSYLVALDLRRQGSMQPGFPVRLNGEQFPTSEFDGAPIVLGQQLLVGVATRDNVNLRRSVISIDRETGQIQWRSPILASGMVSGSEQASLISHQLMTASGGRVFVNTNLGAVACLDQASGQIKWLTRYRRSAPSIDQPYPKPDRYRYRDLTPCMLVGTQVVCAPQDCPEIFSLDSTTGDLLWSTDAEQVDDATQLLGTCGQSILVSGDRLYWLHRESGRVLAAFPGSGVGEASTALPSPRGFGRGAIGGDRVYWPTQQEIYVFDADQSASTIRGVPAIRGRLNLSSRGGEGGNLVLFRDGLVVAGASRLFVYRNIDQ